MSETEELDKGPFKAGAPFKFTDVQTLEAAIQANLDSCDPHVDQDGGRARSQGAGRDPQTDSSTSVMLARNRANSIAIIFGVAAGGR